MIRKMLLGWLAALAVLLVIGFTCSPAHADDMFGVYAAANGIWYDAAELVGASPPDFEVGATARASLTPHISAVGSAFYGFDNSYTRGSLGVRFTATDVNDPNFSIGLGIQRHFSSEPAVRPQEWAPDASVGFVPWPDPPNTPQTFAGRVTLVAQGFYGLTSNEASVLVGARFALAGGK